MGRNWCIPANILQAFPSLTNLISLVQIPETDMEDNIVWKDSSNGELSLQQAYDRFQKHSPDIPWKNLIWNKHVPPSHAIVFPGTISNIKDCFVLMLVARSPQAAAVVISMVCSIFYHVWRARNSNRFDGKRMHWKTSITQIMARAKWVGDNMGNPSDNNITSFSILKGMQININPRRPSSLLEILWCPPHLGWVKVNIDGVAHGNPVTMACGGMFRDNKAIHLGSLYDYMGEGNSELAELWATMIAIEKAVSLGWRKLWMETGCLLVVKAFTDPALVPRRIRSRWLRCHTFSQSIDFMISHIYREANFCVDYLANIGHNSRSFCWFNFVHPIVVKDYLLDKDDTPRLRLVH
ncbi:uncharacterized protein LOC131605630 [Vicia villosa]|uniref:uncharacterized protein LOC131605630 n=1 Tax=Vicia villosa TaxID=3911 RepID=UPI00273C330D|nr:uncharacterized protein LOC131605630 [Vicia villosa]